MFKNFTALLLLLLCCISTLQAQSTIFWSDVVETPTAPKPGLERRIIPSRFRTVQLNINTLKNLLPSPENQDYQVQSEITLPMPNGGSARFLVWETPVMDAELQARYPEIRCYTGKGLDDPGSTLKCDLTPWGFHAMSYSATQGTVFIDPYWHGDAQTGIVYFKKDYEKKDSDNFACLSGAKSKEHWQELDKPKKNNTSGSVPDFAGDCRKRSYRLALACTGEYANFHGGTKPLVLAAMNTSMNRVNGLYEKDFAVTMVLIPKNDTLIFLNASTDPYTNDDGGAMLDQNQATVTQRIGAANYDIGHVFSTGGGGIAGLGVVCVNSNKANGVTGAGMPVGDPFDIDYVAHEMGHQFDGDHCFNNSCSGNRNNATAMEPGSGSTIMAYAGICPPNVQNNSDDYFHAVNIQQISAYINTGNGNGCAVKTVTGNSNPVVSNVPNYNIPKSTPFALTAIATDPDNDPLTYCWEQMDATVATMPPVSTSTGGPLFRSYNPVVSPTRYFPRLQDLITNTNSTWEELPGVARTMNFRVIVRDNRPGGGCTGEDDVTLTVSGTAGPFQVSAPNTNVSWNVGDPQTVTWNVNATDLAPINCANVRISLSTDGGFTYPIILAGNVPNNGSASIIVPNAVSTSCRVKVEAIGNVFFDISNANFRIQLPPAPTFTLYSSPVDTTVCAGQSLSLQIETSSVLGYATPVNLSLSGAPADAVVDISPNPVMPGQTATALISNLSNASAGTYTLTVSGISGALTRNFSGNFSLLASVSGTTPVTTVPADGATGLAAGMPVNWNAIPFASSYTVQFCTNPAFSPAGAVLTLNSTSNAAQIPVLNGATPYYWRVKASNSCGEGSWSTVKAFQMSGISCNQNYSSVNVPLAIDVNGATTVSSTLAISDSKIIADANISLLINHTYVGDLDVKLTGPTGITTVLFDRPGYPASNFGCEGNNLDLNLDDEASASAAALESACGNNPAISGAFKPVNALSAFDNSNTAGTWTLTIKDNYGGEDEGQLLSWSLSFCTAGTVGQSTLLKNLPLTVNQGGTKAIATTNLETSASAASSQVIYTLTSLPQNGTLKLNGNTLAMGQTFTQADINAGLLVYTHISGVSTTDAFNFDVWDSNNFGWIYNQTFQINIVQNNLSANASLSQLIKCSGDSNAEITVNATGGTAPLTYSLNGAATQQSNIFSNLGAGTYTVVVHDANGFTQEAAPVVITAPALLGFDANISGNDLTISTTGGTAPMSYSIDGTNFQPSPQFADLADGFYTITVRDANGCTAQQQVIISVAALLAQVTQTASILCFGQATAAIQASAAGGIPPYTYSLDGINFQGAPTFSGLAAGTYTVVVKDANSQSSTATPITVAQPDVLSASAASSLNVITVATIGGTAPYQYQLNGGTAQNSSVFGNLSNGSYDILVTDANGCTANTTAVVNVPVLTLNDLTLENINPCSGIAQSLTVQVSGGIPPYTYRIDGGAWQGSAVFNNILPGIHSVEVQDATGFTVAGGLELDQPAPIVASAVVLGNDVTLSGSGGTSPYTFSLNSGAAGTETNYFDLPNGIYTLFVSDVNGCKDTIDFVVAYTPMTYDYIATPVSCAGSADGSIDSILISGGLAPYTPVIEFPIENLAAGVYTYNITDAAGSSLTVNITISSPPALTATANTSGDTLIGNVTGGVPPYQYSIDNGENFQQSGVFSGLGNGPYIVIVQDANGCTSTAEATIIVISTTNLPFQWGANLYPNPSADVFTLSIQGAPKGQLQFQVSDPGGRRVQAGILEQNAGMVQHQFNLEQVPSGVYFLRLTQDGQSLTLRMVKI